MHLIIYAHPNPNSFNHAILEAVEAKLHAGDNNVIVRDLYQLRFNPLLTGNDFLSFKQGKTPADIQAEQDYIKKADTIIFIHPIWWFGMPALLKGYIDRVFSYGFAYEINQQGIKGLLAGKKVVILNTTGGHKETYVNIGYNDALKKTFQTGTFEFCGMKIALHKYFYAVPFITDDARKTMLEEVKMLPI